MVEVDEVEVEVEVELVGGVVGALVGLAPLTSSPAKMNNWAPQEEPAGEVGGAAKELPSAVEMMRV